RLRMFASIDERDAPRLSVPVMDLHLIAAEVKCHVGSVQEIVGKVLFDHVSLVAKANNEIINAMVRVDLEDMPKDRFATNLDHWFGSGNRFLTQTSTEAPSKNYRLHGRTGMKSGTCNTLLCLEAKYRIM